MSEKRATTSGGLAVKQTEARGADSLARLSDHLGRLLAHADKLLAEWQAHADGMRGRFEKEAASAGEILARSLEAALADVAQSSAVELQRTFTANAEALRADLERARQAAADLEAHTRRLAGGAKPTSVDELRSGLQGISRQLGAFSPGHRSRMSMAILVLAVTANLMLAALALRPGQLGQATAPRPPEPIVAPPQPVVVAPDAGPPPAPPPSPAACTGLTPEAPVTAAKLAGACVARLCTGKLSDCKRDDGAGADLVAALRTLERERPLARLACPPPAKDPDGRYTLTVRWLLDCPTTR